MNPRLSQNGKPPEPAMHCTLKRFICCLSSVLLPANYYQEKQKQTNEKVKFPMKEFLQDNRLRRSAQNRRIGSEQKPNSKEREWKVTALQQVTTTTAWMTT